MAICLSGCGGGGGGSATSDDLIGAAQVPAPAPAPSAPAPAPSTAPSPPAPAPAPAPATNTVQISASTTAEVNTHYVVNAAGAGTIDITLPGLASVGDFVSVRGLTDNAWRLIPGWAPTTTARSAAMPFVISTTNLAGNTPAGQQWTARLDPRQWHWVASDPLGSVLVAADIPGQLHVSLDAGATWDAGNSPTANWVSVAMSRTPSASDPLGAYALQLVAVAYGGGIYRYAGGAWTQVTDPSVNLSAREWESVNLDPGGGILAAVLNGPIYYQTSTGFAAATAAGSTTPLVRGWRALAGRSVAVSQDGEVWVSSDGGQTWVQRNVTIGGSPVYNSWYRAAASGDGNTIAVAGRYNSGLYISRDRGLTWTQAPAPVGDYTAVAMSNDGQVIGATITNGTTAATTGSVQLSRNGGASFNAVTMPGTDTNWRAIAMAADADLLVVAAGTYGTTSGRLYTSLGDRTSYATVPGSIMGGAGGYVEVEYVGGNRWSVRTSSGGPFTVR